MEKSWDLMTISWNLLWWKNHGKHSILDQLLMEKFGNLKWNKYTGNQIGACIHFVFTLIGDILFSKWSSNTYTDFLKTPNNDSKVCEEVLYNLFYCVSFCIVTFRIIREIWDFRLQISLKSQWKFSWPICSNPGPCLVPWNDSSHLHVQCLPGLTCFVLFC